MIKPTGMRMDIKHTKMVFNRVERKENEKNIAKKKITYRQQILTLFYHIYL